MTDRFDSNVVDSEVTCANCGTVITTGDALYDERAEHYLCDRRCFYEWSDVNFEAISDYYFDRIIN